MTALIGAAPDTDDTRGAAEIPFDDACRLVYRVGLAAHGYGSSAVEVETYLSRLLFVLGYRGVIRTGPPELLFAIDEEGGRWPRTPARTPLAVLRLRRPPTTYQTAGSAADDR